MTRTDTIYRVSTGGAVYLTSTAAEREAPGQGWTCRDDVELCDAMNALAEQIADELIGDSRYTTDYPHETDDDGRVIGLTPEAEELRGRIADGVHGVTPDRDYTAPNGERVWIEKR